MENIELDETFTNNILVIGNGFDIANCYKTRYSDFLDFIKKEEYIKYKSINEYEVFTNLISKNSFLKHFIDSEFNYYIWSDVETEIYKIICAINKIYNDEGKGYEFKNFPNSSKKAYVVEADPYVLKTIKEFSLVYELYEHLVLSDLYFDIYNKINWKQLNNYLVSELNDFKKILIIYLAYFVPLIYEEEGITVNNCTKQQLLSIKPNSIITFNYTDYYKNYYDTENVIYIHGNLKQNNIVLGFNDDNENDLHYVRFKKYFQIIQNKTQTLNRKSSIFNVEDQFLTAFDDKKVCVENIVYFYGLSFDVTDEDIIKEIYFSNNTKKIYIYYYDDNDYDNKVINLIKIFGKDKIIEDRSNGKLDFIRIDK